jgi:hypothetical protein
MGERRGAYRVLVGRPERKRSLGRPMPRWEDNMKTDLQEAGCGVMDSIYVGQNSDKWRAVVNADMKFGVP